MWREFDFFLTNLYALKKQCEVLYNQSAFSDTNQWWKRTGCTLRGVTWWVVKCSCSWGRRCTVFLQTPLAQQRSLAFQKFLLDKAAGLSQPCAGESSAVCLNSDRASQCRLLVYLWFLWWSHLQEGRVKEDPSNTSCCALGFMTAVKTEHSVPSIMSSCAYPFDPFLNPTE